MDAVKFIMWADTHWDKLGAKCVTLEDTFLAEKAIFERAVSGYFDFTLFAGDRFLKREPDDETKIRADSVIFDYVNGGDIPHYHLIGNHDWVDNTRRWHTSESLKRFCKNIYVMDQSMTYFGNKIAVHALPADFQFDFSNYEIDKNRLNIFVFHDSVKGCYLSEDRSIKYEGGVNLSTFDRSEFDLVVAGDIHIRQDFNFKHTIGGYLGSLVQRTRADSNAERGWTEVTAHRKQRSSKWEFDFKFVPTKNLFSKVFFVVDDNSKIEDFELDWCSFKDQFLEIRLVGNKKNVDRISNSDYWRDKKVEYSLRNLEVVRAYDSILNKENSIVVELSNSNNILEDLKLYVKSNFSSLGTVNYEKVYEIVKVLELEKY
jgi:DNA repair exonuclease SbcCD nuclease subunit